MLRRLLITCSLVGLFLVELAVARRVIIPLDGTWEAGQSTERGSPPDNFDRRVPVPGLIDMAVPPFQNVGVTSQERQFFWYRKVFKIEASIPETALLKIHKAKYGTAVYLNGRPVGEHMPCFTPALLDVRTALNGQGEENELLIRVGASRDLLPAGQPGGWDFEKYRYIPGIYDSVELILSGNPFIANVQTVPSVESGTVRVLTEFQNRETHTQLDLEYHVFEAETGKPVGSLRVNQIDCPGNQLSRMEVEIPIRGFRLWTPEEPFLYTLTVQSGTDSYQTRFGMRSFRFDRGTGRAILNGKPYFMRGSNVTVLRFFEDESRGGKPWDREWVRKLHRKFKSMHWNSLRYCIGFPPELWYEIADEEGLLIQDEFPIWTLSEAPESPASEKIVPEYVEWMRERWNHPSVVIWDAQNESVTEETGKAILQVRHLDLSNRPWDNGWAAPQSPTDMVEAHPYLFIRDWQGQEPFQLSEISQLSGLPNLQEDQERFKVPIIINEYAWLWLQRNGTPTSLTHKIYDRILGPDATPQQRREIYARYLAALTEFWRSRRQAAGVLHFCGLGYSRRGDIPRPEGGATSDNFLSLDSLEFEPYFEEYVRDAFSPVGIMLDFWDEEVRSGEVHRINVVVINDLYVPWEGNVDLRVLRAETEESIQNRHVYVGPMGTGTVSFRTTLGDQPASYNLVASLTDTKGEEVRSLRTVAVKPPEAE